MPSSLFLNLRSLEYISTSFFLNRDVLFYFSSSSFCFSIRIDDKSGTCAEPRTNFLFMQRATPPETNLCPQKPCWVKFQFHEGHVELTGGSESISARQLLVASFIRNTFPRYFSKLPRWVELDGRNILSHLPYFTQVRQTGVSGPATFYETSSQRSYLFWVPTSPTYFIWVTPFNLIYHKYISHKGKL